MKISLNFDEAQSLLSLDVLGSPASGEGGCSIHDHLTAIASHDAEKLLLDYSGLDDDIVVDDLFLFVESCQPMIARLKDVKLAAVVHERLRNISVLLSIMFGMGVWVAIFKDRDQALAWLNRSEERPRWLRDQT